MKFSTTRKIVIGTDNGKFQKIFALYDLSHENREKNLRQNFQLSFDNNNSS